jgi:hypothetical protein
MQPMYYIGLDVHKRKISYCVKDGSGQIYAEGSISATRLDLGHWMRSLPQPWSVAMEATMFTGWIYDHLPAACCRAQGGAPADAASHCRREKEERPHRRYQDSALLALRFSKIWQVPHP